MEIRSKLCYISTLSEHQAFITPASENLCRSYNCLFYFVHVVVLLKNKFQILIYLNKYLLSLFVTGSNLVTGKE